MSLTEPDLRSLLLESYQCLARLADGTEIAGMGDADDGRNDTPEMQARLRMARQKAERIGMALHLDEMPEPRFETP